MRVTATMPEMRCLPSPYKNIEEFEALMHKYATITLDEIEELWAYKPYDVPRRATGYGTIGSCTLCMAVNKAYVSFLSSLVSMDAALNDPCGKCAWAEWDGLIGRGRRYKRLPGNDSTVMTNTVTPCASGRNSATYSAIEKADKGGQPGDILKAFRARAKHMQKRLDDLARRGIIELL